MGLFGQATVGNPNAPASRHEDSLKLRYGTPPSLPKKPPPTETKHASDASVAPAAVLGGTPAQGTAVAAAEKDTSPLVVNGDADTM